MSSTRPASSTADALADVKQLGLVAGIASLSYVFWVVGGMEMVERLAYYGVKAVASLYATDSVAKGGLGITMTRFGLILTAWAFVQSFVPAVTGGLSDRYGYKETIFISTIIKISGYLTMAMYPTFNGFFVGAMLLAFGTAVFKPGIQGTLVKCTSRENSSIAWAVFYQTVNIGGFIGPLVAGLMRKMAWNHVFYACAGIICFNFLLLLCYKEVGKEERLERQSAERDSGVEQKSLFWESMHELSKAHVWIYLAIFSGFWFMFNALFDVLPNHIQDWVDTTGIVQYFFGDHPPTHGFLFFFFDFSKDGKSILPEGMLNLNAGMIMTICFLIGAISGKMRATTSMVIGTLFASAGLFLSGYSTLGFVSVTAIAIFSLGEMLSSPKFSEFIGNFAPADKKAMYLGFSQIPFAIGWTLEGQLGPRLYDHYASKELFSREALRQFMSPDAIAKLPGGTAFDELVKQMHSTPQAVTQLLYNSHNPGMVWYIMGCVGIVSAISIWLYGRWILTLQSDDGGDELKPANEVPPPQPETAPLSTQRQIESGVGV
jgi:MFS family permease